MSDFLVSLFELIVISFILIMVFDFIVGLVYLARSVQSQSKVQIEPEAIALETITPITEPLSPLALPDPWMLPTEVLAIPQRLVPAQAERKPLLMLPQAKEDSVQPLPISAKSTLDELLAGVELDKLQLRPARKIAKLLNIPQKLNSKDKPLSFLRAQIKAKIQQSQEISPQTIEAVRESLAS